MCTTVLGASWGMEAVDPIGLAVGAPNTMRGKLLSGVVVPKDLVISGVNDRLDPVSACRSRCMHLVTLVLRASMESGRIGLYFSACFLARPLLLCAVRGCARRMVVGMRVRVRGDGDGRRRMDGSEKLGISFGWYRL